MIHIHNGDVAASLAQRAGIPGEHLSFRESLVSGPVPAGVDLETRARHIAEAHGQNLLRVRNDLLEQERALHEAMSADEIVLWFEHDLYCLIHLLAMLDRFGAHRRLTLVYTREPLGLSSESELPLLFDSRAAITPAMLNLGRTAWRAYTSADPAALNDVIAGGDRADFPFLREGLTLHASRFPSLRNGLGELENRALNLIATGLADFATLFGRLDADHPRFGFGDSEVLRDLRAIAWCAVPLLTIAEAREKGPPRVLFAVTPAAMNVIDGSVDNISVNDPDHWLGGVHLTKENLWRWDDLRRQLLPSRPAAS
ncbi:MAG: polymerase, sigma-24 subunit, subfamily [Acidobacteria bacterium]|nr:polymerase, sigma-24 subunit, subfamily [Acidobacteriota bacterium]